MQCRACLDNIRNINVDGAIHHWTSGGNNNRQVRIVPGIVFVAEELNAPWLSNYIGHACAINGRNPYLILGSITKSTSIPHAGILIGHSWNGQNVSDNNDVDVDVDDNINDDKDNDDNDEDHETIAVLLVLFDGLFRGQVKCKNHYMNAIERDMKEMVYDTV